MRICIFTATIDKNDGGPSRSVPILAKGLAQVGVDVTLMSGESENMNTHSIEGENVKLVLISPSITLKELECKLLEGGFSLIHGQGIWLPLYHKMCIIARKHKIPYMMTPRGALEPWCYYDNNLFKQIKKRIAMAVYQQKDIQSADCILTTAGMEANNLRNLGFTNPIAVIPNGIETKDYPCRPQESIAKCKKQVLFLSRLESKKGIEILIDAWVKVHEMFSDWSLIIVGNGEESYIKALNAQIGSNRLTDSVRVLPPAFGSEKYNLYIESQLFVLPTHSENFGMVIAEALACGVPVLTTQGTPWQILEENNAGWWIQLSKQNLETTLIQALSLSKETLFEMGRRGSNMVRNSFYYIEVAKRLHKTYKWIVEEDEKPVYVE